MGLQRRCQGAQSEGDGNRGESAVGLPFLPPSFLPPPLEHPRTPLTFAAAVLIDGHETWGGYGCVTSEKVRDGRLAFCLADDLD